MNAQQHQLLLDQVRAFRKENQTYKEEFRALNALVKEKEDVLKQYRKSITSLKNELRMLREQDEVLEEAIEENARLKDENQALRHAQEKAKEMVSSSKTYLELPYHGRTRLKKKLFSHFANSLKRVDDWAKARITIFFTENTKKHFWQQVYSNVETDIDQPSDPVAELRWYDIEVMRIVHASDRFMISNQGYHEIQMNAEKGLPSTSCFKKAKKHMSNCIPIDTSENDEMDAAKRSVRDVLMRANLPTSKRGKYFIRLSVDGAVVARNRFAVTGCIKVFDCNKHGKPKQFSNNPHLKDELPIFHIFGPEDYETLRTEAADSFNELRELKANGLLVEGKHHDVELLLTCDWKCQATILGVNPPTCKFFCINCDGTSEERFIFTESDLGKWKINRGEAHHAACMAGKEKKGYTNAPLLDIDFENCPTDYLHLCKGVISKQFHQIVRWALDQGNQQKLEEEMKRIKVPFSFYTEQSSDGQSSIQKWTNPPVKELRIIYEKMIIANVLDATIDKSLKAVQNLKAWELREHCSRHNLSTKGKKEELVSRIKGKLGENIKVNKYDFFHIKEVLTHINVCKDLASLNKLWSYPNTRVKRTRDIREPPVFQLKGFQRVGGHIQDVTGEDTGGNVHIDVEGIQDLWRQGRELLLKVRNGVDDVDALQRELLEWGVKFMERTFPEDVSPYIHVFVFHTHEFVRKFGGLGAFEMEEVERLNSINKSAFFRKTHQGKNPKKSAYLIMRYWNRILIARTYQYSRPERAHEFFSTKKDQPYNVKESSDDEEPNNEEDDFL